MTDCTDFARPASLSAFFGGCRATHQIYSNHQQTKKHPFRHSVSSESRKSGASGLSAERKKEILDRLLAERATRKAAAASPKRAAPRDSISQMGLYLLSASGAEGSANKRSGDLQKETREQLIQRLVREKRERDTRREEAAKGEEAFPQYGSLRGGKEAWPEKRGGDAKSPERIDTPDSLDESQAQAAGRVPRSSILSPVSLVYGNPLIENAPILGNFVLALGCESSALHARQAHDLLFPHHFQACCPSQKSS